MRLLSHLGVVISLIVCLSGCATRTVLVGQPRPAISPAAVRIYQAPPRHYETIAILNSSAGMTWLVPDRGSLDDAIGRLREEAAAVGANGVLLQEVYEEPAGGLSVGVGGFGVGGGPHHFYGGGGAADVGGPLLNRRVRALAIYVR